MLKSNEHYLLNLKRNCCILLKALQYVASQNMRRLVEKLDQSGVTEQPDDPQFERRDGRTDEGLGIDMTVSCENFSSVNRVLFYWPEEPIWSAYLTAKLAKVKCTEQIFVSMTRRWTNNGAIYNIATSSRQ